MQLDPLAELNSVFHLPIDSEPIYTIKFLLRPLADRLSPLTQHQDIEQVIRQLPDRFGQHNRRV